MTTSELVTAITKALTTAGWIVDSHIVDSGPDSVKVTASSSGVQIRLSDPDASGPNGASSLGNTLQGAGYTYTGTWEAVSKGGTYTV